MSEGNILILHVTGIFSQPGSETDEENQDLIFREW